jgi:hypothetical protein
MPQLPGADSKGPPLAGTPALEDSILSVASVQKDQKLEGLDDNASRLAKHWIRNQDFPAEDF